MPSDNRWQQVDALFRRALERPDRERDAFVRREAADDPELQASVDALLAAQRQSGEFLRGSIEEYCELPWDRVFGPRVESTEAEHLGGDRSGETVGRYQLMRCIGRGGMASVYEAERADGQFNQRVAVKVLRRGLDTDDIVRRFLSERQILSSLSHPNIARVFDGGATQDGLPFLVMEYVDGTPLLAWCDERKATVAARLRLFCEVGRAVQYAHRSLVVHRDLKPSNIMVDARGRIRLLDFGIAKLLTDDPGADRTRTGIRPMTPAYASPELIRGDAITTGSDVYQLGLLLCQLLTGEIPYRVGAVSPALAERLVLEAVPSLPSTLVDHECAALRSLSRHDLRTALTGDLDAITLKALRAEPEDRYGSAEALIDDVERHLDGVPIRARANVVSYRLKKFVARNRIPIAAGVSVLLVLLASAVTATWQAGQIAAERDRAIAQERTADAVTAFLGDLFTVADPNANEGESLQPVELLDRGAARALSELQGERRVQAKVLSAIGAMYLRHGLKDRAIPLLEQSLQYHRAAGPDPTPLIQDLRRLSAALTLQDADRSISLIEEAVSIAEAELGADHRQLAGALTDLAQRLGSGPRSDAAAERALAILRHHPEDVRSELASVLQFTAYGDYMERFERLEEALAIRRELYGENHTSVAAILSDMALKIERVDPLAADTLLERAAEINLRIHGPSHHQTLTILNNLAGRYRDRGEVGKAEPLYREVLERRLAAYPDNHGGIAYSRHGLGWSLNELGRADEAEPLLREAVSYLDPGSEPPRMVHQIALSTLGRSFALQRRFTEAEPLLVASYEWASANSPHPFFVPVMLDRVIQLYAAWGKPDQADSYRRIRSAETDEAPVSSSLRP